MGLTKFSRALSALTIVGAITASFSFTAYAATLTSASVRLGDSRPGQTTTYTLGASGFSTGQTIGCIEMDFGSAVDGTGSIAGMNTASSTFSSQSVTATGTWAVDNSQSAAHKVRLTNATPVAPQAGAQTAVWGSIVNGSTANTPYYAVITTYTTNSCATPSDSVTVQFIYTDGQAASVNVDGTLTFSVAGFTGNGVATVSGAVITNSLATTATTIPFGTATSGANRIAAQDLSVATNAGSGYTVYIRGAGTGILTNGTGATIDPLATFTNTSPGAFSAAGTEAFGYTTEDGVLGTGTTTRFSGSNKWAALSTTNSEIIYNAAATGTQTTRVGYQVGVSSTTDPGAYNATVIYTATPLY